MDRGGHKGVPTLHDSKYTSFSHQLGNSPIALASPLGENFPNPPQVWKKKGPRIPSYQLAFGHVNQIKQPQHPYMQSRLSLKPSKYKYAFMESTFNYVLMSLCPKINEDDCFIINARIHILLLPQLMDRVLAFSYMKAFIFLRLSSVSQALINAIQIVLRNQLQLLQLPCTDQLNWPVLESTVRRHAFGMKS